MGVIYLQILKGIAQCGEEVAGPGFIGAYWYIVIILRLNSEFSDRVAKVEGKLQHPRSELRLVARIRIGVYRFRFAMTAAS